MSHHIFTSGGAAHDIKLWVAPASVSFAGLETAINIDAYIDEDTTDAFNPYAPGPSWCHRVVKTSSQPVHSKVKRSCPYRQAFAVRQGLAVIIVRPRSRGIMRIFLRCLQVMTINTSTGGWCRCYTADLKPLAMCGRPRSPLKNTCVKLSQFGTFYSTATIDTFDS